jgi:hypothetical protein
VIAGWVVAGCAVVMAGLWLAAAPLNRLAERRVTAELQHAYGGQLHVQSLHIRLFPRILVDLEGVTLQRDAENPPLISIAKASASTGYGEILRVPAHIRSVRLQQLEIHVPPRGQNRPPAVSSNAGEKSPRFVIDELTANGTILEILPKRAGKLPLVFDIRDLTVNDAGPGAPMKFRAILTNAKPPGDIQSSGNFGPWQIDDPALTPVNGAYKFQNADLSVFKGIAGTLSSEGSYKGVLDQINVEGHTDVPDFAVKISGNPVHLTTQFQAVVDGMNGDVRLDPVNGQFGHTSLVARGVVEGNPGEHGKTVDLDVQIDQGRLEDVIRLGVKGKPAMTGAIAFRTKLVIPPGPVEIPEKLLLNGEFAAGQAQFEKLKIQQRVDKLSARGRGDTDDADDPDVASNFKGRFALKDGSMSFEQLSFQVPGAEIALHGTYGLLDEKIDMHGTAQLSVKLSKTVTGIKSVLLKPLDPLFSKNGVETQLPIHIGGTRTAPSFGLDLRSSQK